MSYVIGLDYGTDSVRAILVNCANGEVVGNSVYTYPRWAKGQYCDPQKNQFRQHPLDHLEGLRVTLSEVVISSKINTDQIKGICVDTTGSSPMPVNVKGESLAMTAGFEENPNAMMILWKDHTAIKEAAEITELARTWAGEDFTKYSGGIYSSEWFWSKILSVHRKDKAVAAAAFSWVEHCDYITGILTGIDPLSLKRSRCAAGHKALWHQDWDGLPPAHFLSILDQSLPALRENLYVKTFTSNEPAGTISKEWAKSLGLSEKTVIAVGTIDAHAGAVGAGIKENTLVKVVGTSTCDMLVASDESLGKTLVKGICGQVEGSILPGFHGLEAGQAGFGDVLAWFVSLILAPSISLLNSSEILDLESKNALIQEFRDKMIFQLSEDASNLSVVESKVVSLDWINGRRSPDADESLEGAIIGLNMGTTPAHIFRSLVESLCFGSRRIIDRFEEEGLQIEEVIAIGGVANKSKLVMQIMADILDRSIKITASTQTPALGAAIYAAVACGEFPTMEEASKAMAPGFDQVYEPNFSNKEFYDKKYKAYQKLGTVVEDFNKRG
ncbi:L-ribulokinase [Algoriphagus ratkowskyi]|uniref:Ribulokinase n=1 Tax=Algoriphagus ratkowskyi TaxID=57028 RepID=A0A2W7QX21_9BACT|nr:ribulokinase [Algoriphagus ratkowskyi]PZX53068.1 L-ribulokinase [Algoriphagus ratkowskyi]TXD76349.1 ribulokinase [Algoriphagus ratkowskyi]